MVPHPPPPAVSGIQHWLIVAGTSLAGTLVWLTVQLHLHIVGLDAKMDEIRSRQTLVIERLERLEKELQDWKRRAP